MATRNLVPRNSGEGSVGKISKAWESGVFNNLYIRGLEFTTDQSLSKNDDIEFNSGNFSSGLTVGGVDVATINDSVQTIQQTLEESSPFIFFSEVIDNIGVTDKVFYENTPNAETHLSGIKVATAENLKVYIQWDGPNDEYIGTASINNQNIPLNNIIQLGTDTRRFEGYLDNLNLVGETGITGEANGREVILPLLELGGGPTPTNILIDSVVNSTPKAGEEKGLTHLKQGDQINIFVDFDTNDVEYIKVHDYGISNEINYLNYQLEEINNLYRATIPIEVSSRQGSLSVAVQAVNSFGTTGELKESSDFNHSSGTREVDQTYPSISASNPTSYNGRIDGLREGESTSFTNNISNWDSSNGDTILYTALSDEILINNPSTYSALKVVDYADGIYNNSDNVEIHVIKSNNGSTDTKRVNVKIANGPVIISTQMDSVASSSSSPHIIGSSKVKTGDVVNSKIEVDGKGVSINDISVSLSNQGISDGSQTSYNSNYQKTTLSNGNFEISVPINVFGSLGSPNRDGAQSATFFVRNNFGTISDPATTTDTAELLNGTIPLISISNKNYPGNQLAIKQNESITLDNSIENFDLVSYTSPNSQLSISSPNIFNAIKTIEYASGGYNVYGDGGQNNLKISATKTSNGVVIEKYDLVNIANTPLQLSVLNLSPSIESSEPGTTDSFSLTSNQLMLSPPTLSTDSSQASPSILSINSSGTGKASNSFTLTVSDTDTKGTFNWHVSATNLAGIVTSTITTNPTYTLEGFNSRTITASPNSLGAGLAPVGTSISNPNNVSFENISEGGSAPNGGTAYTYQSYTDGIQLDNSYDLNNKFTVCDSSGVTDSNGDHV
ncbi:MAG: hypothetical protein EBY39_11440, partial [Flavobacteriia bacterium]|nr:hypothetical protein [Flavobacteriia bacterium]